MAVRKERMNGCGKKVSTKRTLAPTYLPTMVSLRQKTNI